MLAEQTDELQVDALRGAFDVDAVDQELGARPGQCRQRGGVEAQRAESLPALGHDPVRAVAPATGEIDDQSISADDAYEVLQPNLAELSVDEQPGRDDDVRRPDVEPRRGVGHGDAAADLQAAGPRDQGFGGGEVVARAEHDDVPAGEAVVAVAGREPTTGAVADEVRARFDAVDQGCADDLHHISAAQIDAGSKHAPTVATR